MSTSAATPLPDHWYYFFGIIEPISVLAGAGYAIFFQDNYHAELIPAALAQLTSSAPKLTSTSTSSSSTAWSSFRSVWQTATEESIGKALPEKVVVLDGATRMALAQLGSCYLLIMLNSALMFYALRRHLGTSSPATLESILYYLFAVLGIADWTHILLTIHFLPTSQTSSTNFLLSFVNKCAALLVPSNWNALLFGNIAITFMLFCARLAWAFGFQRQTFWDEKAAAPAASSRQASSSALKKRK